MLLVVMCPIFASQSLLHLSMSTTKCTGDFWTMWKSGEKGPTFNESSLTHQLVTSPIRTKHCNLQNLWSKPPVRQIDRVVLPSSNWITHTSVSVYLSLYLIIYIYRYPIVYPPTSPSPLLGWRSQVDGRRSQQSGYRGECPSNSESWCHLYSLLDYQKKAARVGYEHAQLDLTMWDFWSLC